jgi:hypothetical protein
MLLLINPLRASKAGVTHRVAPESMITLCFWLAVLCSLKFSLPKAVGNIKPGLPKFLNPLIPLRCPDFNKD